MKICNLCHTEKPFGAFWNHPCTSDGYYSACIRCENEKRRVRRQDPERRKKEKARQIIKRSRYQAKYPEKIRAKNSVRRVKRPEGLEIHHWSYNDEHLMDTFFMTRIDHNHVHRFMVYDTTTKMYRSKRAGGLLDTKLKHRDFITSTLENRRTLLDANL